MIATTTVAPSSRAIVRGPNLGIHAPRCGVRPHLGGRPMNIGPAGVKVQAAHLMSVRPHVKQHVAFRSAAYSFFPSCIRFAFFCVVSAFLMRTRGPTLST